MTFRAVILGVLGAAFVCGATFFNDMVMRSTFFVGNFLPITIFGSLVLFLLFINPLLALIGRCVGRATGGRIGTDSVFVRVIRAFLGPTWALQGTELGVIMAMMLFACYIPGRGLMHQFTTFLMLPHHYTRTTPGWQGDPVPFSPDQIEDWGPFWERISGMRHAAAGTAEAVFWRSLSDTEQRLISGQSGVDPTDRQLGVIGALNRLLGVRELAEDLIETLPGMPGYAEHLLEDGFSDSETAAVNRACLDVLFEGCVNARLPGVIDHAPPRMLADPRGDPTVALDGFVNGLGAGDEAIALSDVPWGAWKRALLFWVPVVLAVCCACTGLTLIVHRQWAGHERLPYPTIEFARALLPEKGEIRSRIFQNRLFWTGGVFVFLLHMNNYACVWWPDFLVPVRIRFDFFPVVNFFPVFKRSGVGIWTMFYPTLYFTVIGFAYFLSTDISLSLGLAPYLYAICTGMLAGYGISMNGALLQPSLGSFCYAGGFTGMFLVLVYTGRHYYYNVLQRGLGMGSRDPVEPHAIWGMRAFMFGIVFFVIQLVLVGLRWQLALLYAGVMMMMCVVISRLLAEAGVFYLHTYFFPCSVLWGVLGARAIGPDQLLIMGMLSSVLLIDPREAFMPFAVSGVRLVDEVKCKIGRAGIFGMLAIVVGLVVAIPTTIYLQYQHGAIRVGDGWTCNSVPKFAFDATSKVRNMLVSQGQLSVTDLGSGWHCFTQASPMAPCLIAFSVTFILVLLFTWGRHRFAWWPLHPLLFLTLATWQSRVLAFSFLIGWFVKRSVSKYGGAELYQKIKPLMIGMIAGEMTAGVVPMIIGAIYYVVQGEPPKPFAIYR